MAIWDLAYFWEGVQVAAVALIGVYTYRKEMLNAAGAMTAFGFGSAIVLFTHISWLLLLFSLLGLGSAASRFRFAEKEAAKVAEKSGGSKGRRATRNVIANGALPTLAAVTAPLVASQWGWGVAAVTFTSAIAVAAADTLASEFGSLSKRVFMIHTLKPVPAGTDGGVSLPGQVAALGGAAAIAALAVLFLGWMSPAPMEIPITFAALAIPIVMGFVGCQVDSLLGGTLEVQGLVTKEEVNFFSIAVGALGAMGLAVAFV